MPCLSHWLLRFPVPRPGYSLSSPILLFRTGPHQLLLRLLPLRAWLNTGLLFSPRLRDRWHVSVLLDRYLSSLAVSVSTAVLISGSISTMECREQSIRRLLPLLLLSLLSRDRDRDAAVRNRVKLSTVRGARLVALIPREVSACIVSLTITA